MTTIEIYEIGTNEPTVTDAPDNNRLADLVEIQEEDILVLVNDAHDPGDVAELDLGLTVREVADGNPSISLLRNPRTKVTIHVHYVGSSASIEVHPASRIRRIRKLAIAALGLDAETAADTSLRLEGSDVDLPPKRPIGAYLNKGQQEITLDLVHKTRPQG